MKRLLLVACGLLLAAACSREPNALSVPTGTQVSVQKKDGVTIVGRLVDVKSDRVVVEQRNGDRTEVRRANIVSINAEAIPVASTADTGEPAVAEAAGLTAAGTTGTASPGEPGYREVTLPAGTVLRVVLETSVGSDISRVEQPVTGRLGRAVTVRGATALPPGTAVFGNVTAARRPGRVQGRGLIAMRFSQIDTPGAGRTRISTATVSRLAPATKGKDAIEILAPAAGAAVLGRLLGGKKAARESALVGGAAGTAYVLSTSGQDVRLGKGARLAVRLTAPVTVRVR